MAAPDSHAHVYIYHLLTLLLELWQVQICCILTLGAHSVLNCIVLCLRLDLLKRLKGIPRATMLLNIEQYSPICLSSKVVTALQDHRLNVHSGMQHFKKL
jgi:hypothetical protein